MGFAFVLSGSLKPKYFFFQKMPQVIFSTDDSSTIVYLFSNINDGKSDTHIAIQDFVAKQPLNCMQPLTVHWNKSDSHIFNVIACSTKRIGVDIEWMKDRPFEKISRRYFHTHEVTDNKEVFYDLWCKKEAYAKWKKDKIALNMQTEFHGSRFIPLTDLPNNCVGYLCT